MYIWPCLFCICIRIPARMPTTEGFSNQQLGTHIHMLETQEPQKRRPGRGSWALAQHCPWAQALAASFLVPGDPKAAPGSPAYEYGPQVANLKNLSVVDLTGRITQGNKIDMAIYNYFIYTRWRSDSLATHPLETPVIKELLDTSDA